MSGPGEGLCDLAMRGTPRIRTRVYFQFMRYSVYPFIMLFEAYIAFMP